MRSTTASRRCWVARPASPSWACSPRCGASIAPTSTPSPFSRRSPPPAPRSSRGPARTPVCCGCPAVGRSPSKSSPITTRPRWSPIRGRRPASAAFCATYSRWAPGRWRCSTACASGPSLMRATGISARVWCAAWATTATSFASEELTQESERRRPQVQVGDPFTEKLLLEASLELIASGHIVAIQDMGAAGLTSSSAEMAARGGVGVEIDLARVPTGEPGMTPYEILLSESQERMLVVAKAERLPQIQAIAAKWELTATPIGRVTDDGMYRATWKQRVVVEIPGQRLIEDCPVYSPAAEEDPEIRRRRAQRPSPESPVPSPAEALLRLLDHPAIASKRWVYEQYDSTVRAGTVIGPGGDAGVIRVRDAAFGIAVTTDGNARYVLLDPFEGGKAAVAEAARNIACTGARPLGITNCLNFGSPERPAVFYQFREACRGIADACRTLGTPVTGGNVSFYNESPTGAVDPTPVVGMVGLLKRVEQAVPSHARQAGDVVFVLGETRPELGGSAYWEAIHGFVGGEPPRVDLEAERRLIDLLVAGAERGLCRSAHDCSQGGLGVALAEVAMGGPYQDAGFGMDVDLTAYSAPRTWEELLFSESHGRAVITCAPERAAAVAALAQELGVPAYRAGTVGEYDGSVRLQLRDAVVHCVVRRLREVYFTAIPRRMGD